MHTAEIEFMIKDIASEIFLVKHLTIYLSATESVQ